MKTLVEDLLFLAKNEGGRLPACPARPLQRPGGGLPAAFESVAFEQGKWS